MNHRLSVFARTCVERGAMLACAAGVGVWGAILLAPSPPPAPPALAGEMARAEGIGPVAGWFGAGPALRVQVSSSGLIAAGASSSAILAVDGGKPRAYRVGQALSADLVLSEVRPDGVVVTQGGQASEVRVPALPPVSGIARANAAAGG